jgi:anaerobic magnesium-protoporphyrin IX monomethyl ester cyclase
MSKKVVFFFPSFASSEATAPLGLLAVAKSLLRAGYSIQLIDSTITPNYKGLQNFQTIYETAARCLEADIRPTFNIIFAYPGEEQSDRRQTINFIMDMCRRHPGAEFWTNIFTPYPGAPVMEHAEEFGIQVPTSFEGWSDFFPRYTVLPWLKGSERRRLQIIRDYLRPASDRFPIAADSRSKSSRFIQKSLSIPVCWRFDHDVYAFPAELWINEKLKRRTASAKPAVDAKRLEPATIEATC